MDQNKTATAHLLVSDKKVTLRGINTPISVTRFRLTNVQDSRHAKYIYH